MIVKRPQLNLESIRTTLIEDDFAAKDLRSSMLTSTLGKKKKDFLTAFLKSAGLIKKLVDKSLYPLLSKKSAIEIWTILEKKFQHIFPMSITIIFLDVCTMKLLDCNNVIDYTSRYQITFDKLFSFFNTKLWMSKKTIKMTLQRSLLYHLKKNYIALVSAIEIN